MEENNGNHGEKVGGVHLQQSTLLLIGVALLIGLHFAYSAYSDLQNQIVQTNLQNQEDQREIQDALEEAAQTAEAAKDTADEAQSSLAAEKIKNQELQQDLVETIESSQEQIDSLEQKVSLSALGTSNSAVADEWSPRVGYVYCLGYDSSEWSGSATAFLNPKGEMYALTNYHVLQNAFGCVVSFPGDSETYTIMSNDMYWDDSPYDWALFWITNPSSYLYSHVSLPEFCAESSINLGSEVVILGYPTYGATTSITVTQGIISGTDEGYFVTDAKIDHGNSGGAAINSSLGCFVGIPTAARTGQIESYGRILDVNRF